MTKPWQSDTNLDENTVKQLIQTNHPEITIHQVQRLDQGWDNDVFLVNEKILFRFCRREWAIPFIETEIRVLPLLKNSFSFRIPTLICQGLLREKYPYCAYEKIPGIIAANCQLTPAERKSLALPIVDLLNEIHNLPIEGSLAQSLPPDTIGRLDITKRMSQIKQKLPLTKLLYQDQPHQPDQPDITQTLTDITDQLTSLLDPQEHERISCLVHGDLYSRNILIEDRTRIAGLIDWTDIHLGHPAKDFAFAVSFLPPAAFHMVANRYKGFDMPLFYLAVMSALNLSCHLTEYALDINDLSLLAECRTAFLHIRDNFMASR